MISSSGVRPRSCICASWVRSVTRGEKSPLYRHKLTGSACVGLTRAEHQAVTSQWVRCRNHYLSNIVENKNELDAKSKPDCSAPGYPPSRLLVIADWSIFCSVNWFTCVQRSTCTSRRTPPSTEWLANPILWIKAAEANKHRLLRPRPLKNEKLTLDSSSAAIVPAALCNFGRNRSDRCWDTWSDGNR